MDRLAPRAGTGRSSEASRQQEPGLAPGCHVCHASRWTLVCSSGEMLTQRRLLERFYRRRWLVPASGTSEDRWIFMQNHLSSIVACLECGLLYRNPRPRLEAITRAYRAKPDERTEARPEVDILRRWYRSKAATLSGYLPTPPGNAPRVLEIGGVSGRFQAEGQALGWEMLVLEPGRAMAGSSRRQGLSVLQGTEPEAFAPRSFDAITIWNTFDQLSDPHALLKSVVPLVRRDGLVVIRIPNGACFEWMMTLRARVAKPLRRILDAALAWNNLLTFPYLYGYSPAGLAGLMRPFGLTLRSCRPDTATPVRTDELKWWAGIEERVVKSWWRTTWAVSRQPCDGDFHLAPWLDVYFVRNEIE